MNQLERFIAWGDRYPIIYHAILFLPVGALGAGYELLSGSLVPWPISTGVLLTLAVLVGQEWADQRAHDAIARHHEDRAPQRSHDFSNIAATARKEPEVWHGWDWRDLLGGMSGGLIGAAALVMIL